MPLSHVACYSLSHHTAPVKLREHVSRHLDDLLATAPSNGHGGEPSWASDGLLNEVMLLSTCNRVELYACVASEAPDPRHALGQFLERRCGISQSVLNAYFHRYRGKDAANHLCRVAAGLDSLVLGESQILGQVSHAHAAAVEAHAVGSVLSPFCLAAIRAGKRVRTETAISESPASISSVALTLAEETVGDLRDRRILVIGLGEMGQLTLKHLRTRGVTRVAVANRTVSRAEVLAAERGYRAYGLGELSQALAGSDVVISTTAAPKPVLDADIAHKALANAGDRPLVLIDIAVPRDIDPDVCALPGVRLFDMDSLQGRLDEALAARQKEIPHAEAIIEKELTKLDREYRESTIRPLIVDLRQNAESIRRREVERTLHYLGEIDSDTLVHIQHLSHALVNKLLHEPTVRLRERAVESSGREYASTVRDLFGLEAAD